MTTRLPLSRRIASPICSALAGLARRKVFRRPSRIINSGVPEGTLLGGGLVGPRVGSAGVGGLPANLPSGGCTAEGLDTRRTSRAAFLKSVKVRAPQRKAQRSRPVLQPRHDPLF